MATGRFAPSPTGALHVGNLRTALLAWLFARSAGSPFLLRVEDLDPATARPEHEAGQLADLAALGLDHDGPVVRQSDRRSGHEDALARLEAGGHTFRCYCTRREVHDAARAPHGPSGPPYPGTCRDLDDAGRRAREAEGRRAVVRLRADGAEVAGRDRLHGEVAGVVDDVVLRRADGIVAYNLAVVVDDVAAGVEEVVRGDDLLATTPTQVLLARLLDLPEVTYAHVALVEGEHGRRLAKRDHAEVDGRRVRLATTLADLRDLGWTEAEVVGHLAATVGLAAPGERVTAAQLVGRFDPTELPTAPTRWRVEAAR